MLVLKVSRPIRLNQAAGNYMLGKTSTRGGARVQEIIKRPEKTETAMDRVRVIRHIDGKRLTLRKHRELSEPFSPKKVIVGEKGDSTYS